MPKVHFIPNALALIEVEILFLNPVRVQNPDRVEKDCNGKREIAPHFDKLSMTFIKLSIYLIKL
jgi:hypothetical protein